jgi:hypothetical protein
MISFISTQKGLNKQFIAKFERFDALNEKVDHLTREIVAIKNHIQEKKNEESIKYVQDIIDRSWEILQQIKDKEKESIMVVEEKEVEEVKMLSDNIKVPLLDLDKCSLNELINILQNFANDPSLNVHKTSFGSYVANHVIKEKIQRYNNEAMIGTHDTPASILDIWKTCNLPRQKFFAWLLMNMRLNTKDLMTRKNF